MSELEDLQKRARRLEEDSYRELWTLVAETASALKDLTPNQRRPWLASVIQDLSFEQEGLCAICDEPLGEIGVEIDHAIPFCYGGGNERSNIQLAHSGCNRSKRTSVDPHDLLLYLEDRYMNR